MQKAESLHCHYFDEHSWLFFLSKVLAIIVIGLGLLMMIPFHIIVREKNTILKKLKWYKWLIKPNFYLVSWHILFMHESTLTYTGMVDGHGSV